MRAALAMRTPIPAPQTKRDRRAYVRDLAKAIVRLTPPWPGRSEAYGYHTHTVEISDSGNGWTDAHADGTRHRVVHLEVQPATGRDGRPAWDQHRHDIAGRAAKP